MAPIPNLGYEPKITGYAFSSALQPNTVSPGLKGQGGVYYIMLNNRTTKAASPMDQCSAGDSRYPMPGSKRTVSTA